MLQLRSMLNSADNTGAKKLQLIHIVGSHGQRYARLGDIVVCAIKEATPHSQVKKSDVVKAVIVRSRKEFRRPSGIYIRFDDNAAVIIDPKNKEPKGTRILGPVGRELRAKGFQKIISLASEVL